jgi:hypothetical protein
LRYLLFVVSDGPEPVEHPSKQDLVRLLEALRGRIEELLQRHGCAPEPASTLLREAVLALTHRWNRVRDREQWLLDRIEKAARRPMKPSSKEPSDDEEPPA